MPTLHLSDKAAIERFLRGDPALHVYELGDLDDFYWPHTQWYGLEKRNQLRQVAMVYSPPGQGVLLALTRPPLDEMAELLESLTGALPRRVYAHLTPGLEQALVPTYRIERHGR
ncbi:MAG: GNAT family N-acetyltransferase, partial [Candidatus Eisenbacteria bacterium]|nr:GNAT family N-acetyltransferase [Candidatus Eisenbacteria bacterium]